MNAVTTTQPRPQIVAGGSVAALVPQSLDEAFRVSQAIAASGLAPRGLEKPEQIMVAIMAGAELGFAPFQSLQSFAVVNGRPTLWGDGLVAVVRRNGCTIREWHEDDTAFCEVKRPDTGETILRSFSQADAAKAGLSGKTGPWQQYPQRMRAMRARAWAVRDGCADMLRGFQVAEEVQDYQPITARTVPTERPNLAARLAAPNDAPREGFSAIHGLSDDDHIPDFDAEPSSDAASNKPASDPASDPSDAGDHFPGDLPPAEDTTASGAEADADEGTSLAVDVIARADHVIADIEFKTLSELKTMQADRKFVAFLAAVRAQNDGKAAEVEKVLANALESYG